MTHRDISRYLASLNLHVTAQIKRKGLRWAGHVPRAGGCPKSEPVPSIFEGMSQERACPKHFKGFFAVFSLRHLPPTMNPMCYDVAFFLALLFCALNRVFFHLLSQGIPSRN